MRSWKINLQGRECEVVQRKDGKFVMPPEMEKWRGYNVALKPSAEHWILCRKPLSEPTVAKNVLRWGTGGLNIDATRVSTTDNLNGGAYAETGIPRDDGWHMQRAGAGDYKQPSGRWPSNLCFTHSKECRKVGVKKVRNQGGVPSRDTTKNVAPTFTSSEFTSTAHYFDPDGTETVEQWECVEGCPIRELSLQSGLTTVTGKRTERSKNAIVNGTNWGTNNHRSTEYQDVGTATRFFPNFSWDEDDLVPFFYTPKASRRERDAGCDTLPEKACGMMEDDNYPIKTGSGNLRETKGRNSHPTVKPLALIRWLCRLVCPPEGTVLDPFTGSGTTGCAAVLEGFKFLGIERDDEYVEIAKKRIAYWEGQRTPTLFDL
jgi:hypothetical protein